MPVTDLLYDRIHELKTAVHASMGQMSADDILCLEANIMEMVLPMRSYLNSLSIINTMPPEILIHVFTLLTAQPLPETGVTTRIPTDTSSLENVTHVCRAWRSLALGTPALWTNVDLGWKWNKFEAYIQRSQGCPLSLVLRFNALHAAPGGWEDDTEQVIAQRILQRYGGRIRSLHLESTSQWSPLDLELDAPGIECLMVADDPWGGADPDRARSRGPQPLFSKISTRLKALAIYPVVYRLPRISSPSLTHLYMEFGTHDTATTAELPRDFMRFLGSMPALRFMHVTGSGGFETPPYSGTPVSLLSLRNLTVTRTNLRLFFWLVSNMKLACDVLVCATGLIVSDPDTPFDLNDLRLPPMTAIASPARLEIWRCDNALRLYVEGDRAGTLLVTSHTTGAQDWTAFLSSLHTQMTLASLTTLHIRVESASTLDVLLPHTPRLIELCVRLAVSLNDDELGGDVDDSDGYRPRTPSAIAQMRSIYRNLTVKPPQPITCPELHILGIEVDFHRSDAIDAPHLLQLVATRAEAGHPLRRLSLRMRGMRHPYELDYVNEDLASTFARNRSELATVAEHGCVFDYGDFDEAGGLCRFEPPAKLVDPEARRYWVIGPSGQSYYKLPILF